MAAFCFCRWLRPFLTPHQRVFEHRLNADRRSSDSCRWRCSLCRPGHGRGHTWMRRWLCRNFARQPEQRMKAEEERALECVSPIPPCAFICLPQPLIIQVNSGCLSSTPGSMLLTAIGLPATERHLTVPTCLLHSPLAPTHC